MQQVTTITTSSNTNSTTATATSTSATKLNERYLNDCVVCVIWDQTRDCIYLVDHICRGLWYPFKNILTNESCIDACKKLTQDLNIECEINSLLKIYSTSLLPYNNYSNNLNNNSNVTSNKTKVKASYFLCIPIISKQDGNKLNNLTNNNNLNTNVDECWFTLNQIKQAHKTRRLLGPEPLNYMKLIQDALKSSTNISIVYEPTITFINNDSNNNNNNNNNNTINNVNSTNTNTSTSTAQEQLISSAKFNKKLQEKLYEEFFTYSYPSEYISEQVFELIITSHGLDTNKTREYFNAFDIGFKNNLSFNDYLLGFAALEPITQHGGVPAEQRCRYIFRYYNTSMSGQLSFNEFKILVNDIFYLKKIQLDDNKLHQEVINSFKIFNLQISDSLSLAEFLAGVGQLKFRGTSVLFRLTQSIIESIKLNTKFNIDLTLIPFNNNYNNNKILNNNELDSKNYELATHTIKVKRTGVLVDISTLWELDGATTPSAAAPLNKTSPLSGSTSIYLEGQKPQFDRFPSIDCFNLQSHPNEMLTGLRYFEKAIKLDASADSCTPHLTSKEAFSWGKVDMQAMARCLILICQHVQDLLINESRLLCLNSPCYILGDIHGNFSDLICFEKTLWRMGPLLTPASFLFLGDYVDRGANGVECIAYLLAQKLLCPNKFYLLRGNHELRSIQNMFHFHNECRKKFGDDLGNQVWEEVNKVFDCMPLAAIVDNKIFCIHGGIPSKINTLNDINCIQCPLKDPECESQLAWELMWNDPLSTSDYKMIVDQKLLQEQKGFIHNSKRGTAYFFSNDALLAFLNKHNLSHVIRAHEVQQVGFKIQLGGKLLTVFSSSHYCGGHNEAATVLADSNKLRLIRLDTSN